MAIHLQVGKTFVRGLSIVLPIGVTIALLLWMGGMIDGTLQPLLGKILPEGLKIPGLGLGIVIVGVFLVGLVFRGWLFNKAYTAAEASIAKIPLIGTIYGSIKDLMAMVGGEKSAFSKVVVFNIPNSDMRMVGLVTREDFEGIPGLGDNGEVAVYIQMGYQLGGFTVMIPRRNLRELDMSVESGMRFALTAGVSVQSGGADSEKEPTPQSSPDKQTRE